MLISLYWKKLLTVISNQNILDNHDLFLSQMHEKIRGLYDFKGWTHEKKPAGLILLKVG